MAARTVSCQPIDTPYLDIKDLEGCTSQVSKSKELGFSGMLVLYPPQIEIANNGYAPSKEEIESAKQVISLNNTARENGKSIAFSEGRFIAPPILEQAKYVLELSDRIKKSRQKWSEKKSIIF